VLAGPAAKTQRRVIAQGAGQVIGPVEGRLIPALELLEQGWFSCRRIRLYDSDERVGIGDSTASKVDAPAGEGHDQHLGCDEIDSIEVPLIGRMKDYVPGHSTMTAGVACLHITTCQDNGGKGDLMHVTG
jgi:hypothetical protein